MIIKPVKWLGGLIVVAIWVTGVGVITNYIYSPRPSEDKTDYTSNVHSEDGVVLVVQSQCGLELAYRIIEGFEGTDIKFNIEIRPGHFTGADYNSAIGVRGAVAIDFSGHPKALQGILIHNIRIDDSGDRYFDNRIPGTTKCWGNM